MCPTNKIVISGYSIYATGSKQLHQLLGKLQEDTIFGSAQQQCVADCVKMDIVRGLKPLSEAYNSTLMTIE
jgi:hypothetical protein